MSKRSYTFYSPETIQFVMENYKQLTSGQISKILGISTQKVKGIIKRKVTIP